MHVIALKALRDFWQRHPEAERPLRKWHAQAEHARFRDFEDLKRDFGSADYVRPYTVFDVGGNKFRLVAVVRYRSGRIYVRWVMTHGEYDNWNRDYRKGALGK